MSLKTLSSSLGLSLVLGALTWAQPESTARNADAGAPDEIRMSVNIDYHPAFLARQETWDLYVYLDGDLLAWVPRGGQMAPSPEVRFARMVSPGTHVVRLTTEHHERRSKGRWHHQARVSPLEIFFQLEAGSGADLVLRLIEQTGPLKIEQGPVTLTLTQGVQVVQSLVRMGTPTWKWPALCEEIEANLDPAKKVPRKVRTQLEQCLRWPALWRSLDREAPSRDSVRAILARYDYLPSTYKRF